MTEDITLCHPMSSDSRAMKQIASDSKILSANSTYYYALMARDFKSTCMVALNQSRIRGYVTGYSSPAPPNTLVVWQIGVTGEWQKKGIGRKLLIALIDENQPDFLEATISLKNQAAINLFKSVARHFDANFLFSKIPFFDEDDLGKDDEAEHLMHIGPITIKS
ncbi:MAG: GNAT family N-acetyltransferase [Thermodesulfobacteriota bacterium]|nr:GNAT family N-acetyltransferase [Thermodesulfobacteriota bacterium]